MSEEGFKVKVYELPTISSYQDLLRTRKTSSTMEVSKSVLSLNGKNIISESDKRPVVLHKTKSSILNNLNFDFGTLHEFINYDMKLKPPEELFKIHETGKKHDSRTNNSDYLKEKLMSHTKQEVDTRDMKTFNSKILREEEDPKKIAKAAKQFVRDMVNEIYGEDIDVLEERVTKKSKNKIYELLSSIDDDENVRKVMERHLNKPLSEKLEILEKSINQKRKGAFYRQPSLLERANSNVDPKKRFNSQRRTVLRNSVQSSDSSIIDPNSHFHEGQSSRDSDISGDTLKKSRSKHFLGKEAIKVKLPITLSQKYASSSFSKGEFSPSRKRAGDESEKEAYTVKLIKTSAYLNRLYREYQNEGEDLYQKLWTKAEEAGKTNYFDHSHSHKNDHILHINKTDIIVTNYSQKPAFIIHVCLKASFNNLMALNLKGLLSLVFRYSPAIKTINISENDAQLKSCETISQILRMNSLKRLVMSNVGLTSKNFALICLGLADNLTVEEIDFSHNKIDDYGIQSLALILKYTKTLKYMNIVGNKIGKLGMQELDKVLTFNKNINGKNMRIFEE